MKQRKKYFCDQCVVVFLIIENMATYLVASQEDVKFASLSKIKNLWQNEIKNIRLIAELLQEENNPPKELEA